jgi:6-phosphogluconate dehydrogenase
MMQLGMIGLGRMGANMVRRLLRAGDAETTPLRDPEHYQYEYEPGTWGPARADERLAPPDGWHNPVMTSPAAGAGLHAA